MQLRPAVLADDLSSGEGKRRKDPGRLAIFVVGALLLALFVVGVVIAQTEGNKVDKSTPKSLTTTHSETVASAASKATASTRAKPAVSRTVTTTENRGGGSSETNKSAPSEGLLLAVLSTGVILVLVGALYTRITTIKLPGGAEVTLSPEESKQVANQVAAKASPDASQPALAQATSAALQLAQTRKTVGRQPLDQDAIEQIATAGLEAVGVSPEAR